MSRPVLLLLCLIAIGAAPATAPATSPVDRTPATQPTDSPKRIAFALDASGSMINTFGPASKSIVATLKAMTPDQSFTVIVARGETVVTLDKQFLAVTPANTERAKRFLESIITTGPGDAVAAICKSLTYNPDAVWVVTDGDVEDLNAEVDRIAKLNPTKIPINTVLNFAAGDDPSYADNLWRLAAGAGGKCYGLDGRPIDRETDLPRPNTEVDRPAAVLPIGPGITGHGAQ